MYSPRLFRVSDVVQRHLRFRGVREGIHRLLLCFRQTRAKTAYQLNYKNRLSEAGTLEGTSAPSFTFFNTNIITANWLSVIGPL